MMKSPFQQQNQQWQWQQQLRQRQMGAVAAQQQQKQQQAQAARLMQANDPFARAEATMAELRLKARSGRLSQQQLEARLQELTVQDAAGHYWMLGYDTGTWYRHEGGQWVAAIPPGR